ncbi:tRNA (adenosine(37)-N6)-dimethylallyltransferase MiaA [Arenimonas sp. SCN 70-307]|uniref:tRNA (adenosine(37)-N6)-dimethylallyltransferase MiaA n=1 Tax=Arenimonas sp. SCN 70-307 TaxID=1660089 RepID=UPI000B25BDAE|nr:tRNA (adenosine(37)-N6)-dimethylallyltransferase MiaA [Arenimonas sp. SCN 70-307]
MRDTRPLAIALMGPTASGKTALAVDWCQRLDTEVISVDSALVYRGLDIGAAKPDAATRALAPHHLVDVRDPHEVFSAADFAREALPPMQALAGRGRVPLLVGGTGLYFSALLDGLSELPEADPAVRAAIAAEAAERGWPALHAEMAAVDPAAGKRIKPGDSQRITRALEVWRLSGRPISEWQQAGAPRRFPFRVLRLVLAPSDRAVLHERIERRFDQMLAGGFLDEVRRLRADPRLHPDLPSMRAVGYRQAWAHLEGRTDASTFREQAIAATRQLAKRQLTWLRARHEALWFDPASDRARLEQALDAFLTRPPAD